MVVTAERERCRVRATVLRQELEHFFGGIASEIEVEEGTRRGLQTKLRQGLDEFLGGLNHVAQEEGKRRARATTNMTRELTRMFALFEPTIAAATIAIRVMEERAAEERDRRTGRKFSAFDLIRTKEPDLSRIFGELLDPSGSHSQGDMFLSLLLEELNAEPRWADSLRNFRPPGGNNSRIETESPTGPISIPTEKEELSGSVDIVVQLGDNRWIGIENKPDAPDQRWQVDRYLIYLSKAVARRDGSSAGECFRPERLQQLLLLYWSGDGSGPKLESLNRWPEEERERQKQLRQRCLTLPYRGHRFGPPSVEGWLIRCHVECKAERVCVFLHDLLGYIRRRY